MSISPIADARWWAEHIAKKQWFRPPWSRGKIYRHQSAYVTALVVAYGRVFFKGKMGEDFPKRLITYDAAEKDLHNRLLEMRHKVHAHSDPDKWNVRPWDAGGFKTTIVSRPVNQIAEPDIQLFLTMTDGLLERIHKRMDEILVGYITEPTAVTEKERVDRALEAIFQLEVGEMIAIPTNVDASSA